jgi:hypothetical protein
MTKNDTLDEFIDAVDVWREVGSQDDDVSRGSDIWKFDRRNGS